MYYVYFLESKKNGKIYVGFTSKLPSTRLREHNAGTNMWTKNNKPFTLVYYEDFFCEKDARRKELFYKSGFGEGIKKAIVQHRRNTSSNVIE